MKGEMWGHFLLAEEAKHSSVERGSFNEERVLSSSEWLNFQQALSKVEASFATFLSLMPEVKSLRRKRRLRFSR